MLRLMILLLFVLVPARLFAESEPGDEEPKLTIEFYRAERAPAEGLKEVKVRGWKDKLYLHPKAEVTLTDISELTAGKSPVNKPSVAIRLTKKGAEKMRKLTEQHIGKPLAIVVNGEVLNAPTILEVLSGNIQISGLKQTEVDELVRSFQNR